MGITATIMNTATGQPIQKMSFGRMPKPWASFNLENGELVTAERIDVGKPAPGIFAAPIYIWVTIKPRAEAARLMREVGLRPIAVRPCPVGKVQKGELFEASLLRAHR